MKLTLAEPKYLKDSIAIISELVNETQFKITPDAMTLVAMDPANVAMVIFKLLSSTFVEYDVKEDLVIALNLANFKQVLRRAKPNDQLILEVEDSKLKITLKGKSKRTFYIPLIDAEEKEQKTPELDFKATITTDSRIISEAIEDVDIIGESVSFSASEGALSVAATGDLSKATVDIPSDDDTKIIVDDKQKARYSIEYLKKIVAGSKLADKCSVKFSEDYPLRFEFTVLNKLQLAFILAPRVDND